MIGAALATLLSSMIFMFAQIYFAKKFMKLKIYMRDIYLICNLVIIASLIQLTININLGEGFNLIVFVVKIIIFLIFILLGHLLNMFQIKKFIKNFVKI